LLYEDRSALTTRKRLLQRGSLPLKIKCGRAMIKNTFNILFLALILNFLYSSIAISSEVQPANMAIVNHSRIQQSNDFVTKTEVLGEKPAALRIDCSEAVMDARAGGHDRSADVHAIRRILVASGNPSALDVFNRIQPEYMWWIRFAGDISILSIPQALHESNHLINARLRDCFTKNVSFFYDGRIFSTELPMRGTPNYSNARGELPASLVSNHAMSRYVTYVDRAQVHPGNDFKILLDELSAYVLGASMEISLLDTFDQKLLFKEELRWLDGEVGGMVEFMAYTLAYIRYVRLNSPALYSELREMPKLISFISTVWRDAERSLALVGKHSVAMGGRIAVSANHLDYIKSDVGLTELNRLGVFRTKQ